VNTCDAKAATRDYVLKIDGDENLAPLLSIYGGKITTYRKLAEAVLKKLKVYFPTMTANWTENAPMPGGDFAVDEFDNLVVRLKNDCPSLSDKHATRLVRYYGTHAFDIMKNIKDESQMGIRFGGDLYGCEVEYLMHNEWAKTADDVLWRRSNMGLYLTDEEKGKLDEWMALREKN